jgi:aspartyl-tRNA(Asn)/glutamyl-tRNA(Gln) amidotransferase subunit A
VTEDLCYFSATELIRNYRERKLSPVEVTRSVLQRINKYQDKVNAFCFLDDEAVLTAAKASETRWMKNEPKGLVDGVPISIKDLILTRGWPTLFGSRTTDMDQAWDEDAPVTARLREHGAILIGKTTTPEFGYQFITVSPVTGVTRNPWNLEKSPGGSSGGSAVAVAMGMGPLSIGTDGGGSVRIPANWTGVYGMKPTFGRVPHAPRGAFASLSHVGPLTRTVEDAALVMTIISEPDPRDWYALPPDGRDYRSDLQEGVKGLRIGYSPDLGLGKIMEGPWGKVDYTVDSEVAALVSKAVALFSDLGAVVEEVDSLGIGAALKTHSTHWIVFSAKRVRALPAEKRSMLDPRFSEFAEAGERVSLPDFVDALAAREALGTKMNLFHKKYDLLLAPTFHVTAPAAGELPGRLKGPAAFTCPFNLTGQPVASIPCGLTPQGLPVGLQIIGPLYRDDLVLRASQAYESARGDFPLPPLVKAKC